MLLKDSSKRTGGDNASHEGVLGHGNATAFSLPSATSESEPIAPAIEATTTHVLEPIISDAPGEEDKEIEPVSKGKFAHL